MKSRLTEVAPPCLPISTDPISGIVRNRVQALSGLGFQVSYVGPRKLAVPGCPATFTKEVPFWPRGSRTGRLRWAISLDTVAWSFPYLSHDSLSGDDVVLNDAFRFDPLNAYLISQRANLSRTLNILHANFPLDSVYVRVLRGMYRRLTYGCLNTPLYRKMSDAKFQCFYFPNGVRFPSPSKLTPEPADYLLYIGRISKRKAPHLAIRLARTLRRKLTLVGPVEDVAYFARYIRSSLGEGIEYMGVTDRGRLEYLLARAEALVFTSQYDDPQPTVLLEALGYGVPIIGVTPGPLSGFWDVVEDGVNGMAIGRFDSAAPLAKALLGRVNRRQIRAEAEAKWSWEAVAQRFYRPVLEELQDR